MIMFRMHRHLHLVIVLVTALSTYLIFPLQLQSGEPYNYASAIEQYYQNSIGFSLAQGYPLPDFGRYHPNHPLGHALAGWAYDLLKIPALSWIRFVNITVAIFAGLFLYVLLLHLRFSKAISATSVALFLATYCGLFTVLSGEWHMPALALSLAGFWQIFVYIDSGAKLHLWRGAALFGVAACYHLAAFFYIIPVGIVLLFVRPIKERWRELVSAGAAILGLLVIVYIVIPFILFRFQSMEEFSRTFFVYKYLSHVRYEGLEWLQMAGRTILHTVLFTPPHLKATDYVVGLFFFLIFLSLWRFYHIPMDRAKKVILLLTPAWWLATHWVFGARPDALLGWLFVLPFLSLMITTAFSYLQPRAIRIVAVLPVLVFGWNLSLGVLPNSLSQRENAFYFALPPSTPKNTPIAFVESNSLLMDGEKWYAGSALGFRNQTHFLPCCGENNYFSRLKRWAKANPGFVLVANGRHSAIETFFQAEGLRYKRWLDRKADWPPSLIPSTIYVQHMAAPSYEKRLTIWVPDTLLRYQ